MQKEKKPEKKLKIFTDTVDKKKKNKHKTGNTRGLQRTTLSVGGHRSPPQLRFSKRRTQKKKPSPAQEGESSFYPEAEKDEWGAKRGGPRGA